VCVCVYTCIGVIKRNSTANFVFSVRNTRPALRRLHLRLRTRRFRFLSSVPRAAAAAAVVVVVVVVVVVPATEAVGTVAVETVVVAGRTVVVVVVEVADRFWPFAGIEPGIAVGTVVAVAAAVAAIVVVVERSAVVVVVVVGIVSAVDRLAVAVAATSAAADVAVPGC